MRKINAILTTGIFLLFLIHLIWGAFMLLGITSGGNKVFKTLTYILLILIIFHAMIGIKLTADTIIAKRKTGTFYLKENRLFLIRRISGFALMLFILSHVMIFLGTNEGGVYRLISFDKLELITQLLMVLSLIIHLLTNIKPLKIALGLSDKGGIRVDILFILSILLLFSGAAFIIYFIRWQII